jgi:rfaE bifunctional protein nucleotidyltransferase chain/domain
MGSPLQRLKQKLYSREAIKAQCDSWRNAGETLVFTNGCFDILHAGHVDYLAKAASLGSKLIIGLNTDASVKRLKGLSRPLQSEQDRAFILSALEFVSAVVLFDEETPEKLIQEVNPNILVKGADYTIGQVAGADFVIKNGGSVVLLPLLSGRSTTGIIKKNSGIR